MPHNALHLCAWRAAVSREILRKQLLKYTMLNQFIKNHACLNVLQCVFRDVMKPLVALRPTLWTVM